MPWVSEKFLRLLLVLVGVAALGAFGWRVYDYWQRKGEILRPVDIGKLQEKAGGGPRVDPGHLLPFPEYAVIEKLNVTGKDPPRPVVAEPPKPPAARLSERDLQLTFIQYAGEDATSNAAWLTPADEKPDPNSDRVPGDLYQTGDRVRIDSKKDLEVRVRKIGADEVLLGFGAGETAGELVLRMGTYELPDDAVRSLLGAPTKSQDAETFRPPPAETRLNDAGDFEIGRGDAAFFEKLSPEELAAAVPVKPDRDRLSNEVRGLRIQSVPDNSPFSRLGLRADDVVLDVNGQPAVSRDDLLRQLREFRGQSIEVRIERLGAPRVLRYRLP
jgi:hypothetical protein